MNERIRQLVRQAGLDDADFPIENWDNVPLAKFAELIVRECIGVVEGGSFLHDQAPTALFAKECSGAIKRYFGVEE